MGHRRWRQVAGRLAVGVLLGTAAGGTAAAAGAAAAPASCSLYASRSGSDATGNGSWSSPFGSVQRLVKALRSGQTGCLNTGRYTTGEYSVDGLGAFHANTTLSSTPGQHATLTGGGLYIWVAPGADHVTIENLTIDYTSTRPAPVGIQIGGNHDALINDTITNGGNAATCILIGAGAVSRGTVIENDTIHDCGNVPKHGAHDHAIYFQDSVNAVVTNNVIYDASAWAIHLYPSAQGSQITHNVIDDNGFGVTFSGTSSQESNNNRVAYNIITNSRRGDGVQSYWGGRVGTANKLDHNCLYHNAQGNIQEPTTGFSSFDNLIANPGFTNPAQHDYRLKPGSPCLRIIGYDPAVARSVS